MPQAKFIQEMICSEFAAWGSEAKPYQIASVSEMIVETATAEEEEGSYVILKGARSKKPTSSPP